MLPPHGVWVIAPRAPIGWSFIRGESQIPMVAGRVFRVVVDEGSFIQHRQFISEKTVVIVIVNQGGCS